MLHHNSNLKFLLAISPILGSMVKELAENCQRFVIVCSVTGEKPKLIPVSGRRTVKTYLCLSEVKIDKIPFEGEMRKTLSGLRAGTRSSNATYVPVFSRVMF